MHVLGIAVEVLGKHRLRNGNLMFTKALPVNLSWQNASTVYMEAIPVNFVKEEVKEC